MDLVHFRLIGGGTDEEHGSLLVGHFPDDQLLERDDGRLVVLGHRGGKRDHLFPRVSPQNIHINEFTHHRRKDVSLILLLQQKQNIRQKHCKNICGDIEDVPR